MSSSRRRNSCCSMLPSPPAWVPDFVPVALPGAAGGTICKRASLRRGAAAIAGVGAGAGAAGVASFRAGALAATGLRGRAMSACGLVTLAALATAASAAGLAGATGAAATSGWRTARRACCQCCICWRTSCAASPASTPATSSLAGTCNTAPLRSWLMSSPRKASGLARNNASMVWSRLKPRRTSSPLAIFDRVSPCFTGPYWAMPGAGVTTGAAAGLLAGAGGRGAIATLGACSAAGSTAGSAEGEEAAACGTAAGTGAGAGAAAALGSGNGRCTRLGAAACGSWVSGCTTAPAVVGTSTNAAYSRTSRPAPQSTSIRNPNVPCSTGRSVVTRMTGRPLASLPRVKCRSAAMPLGGARPTRRNVSGDASRACSAANSPGVVEMIGISASSGWLRLLLTWICPRPRAQVLPAASNNAATTAVRNVRFTRSPSPP